MYGYVKHSDGTVMNFPFPNSNNRNDEAIEIAFLAEGMICADISRELPCWTWVLTDDGSLYLHDTSHGGGGYFTLQSK